MVFTWIRRFLAPPIFEDEDKTRVAGLLNTILLTVLATAVMYGFFSLVAYPDPVAVLATLGVVALVVLSGLFLMRHGRVQLASLLLSSALWVIVTFLTIATGGVRTPGFFTYIASILIAGLLLGGLVGIGFAGLSILVGLGLLYAEINSLLPQPFIPVTSAIAWGVVTMDFILVSVLLHLATRSINEALERARRNERALAEANERLQREITEREQAEEELRAEKEFSEKVLNVVVDTVFVFDPNTGKPFRWNEAFNEISGFTDEEIASKKAPDDWYSKEDLERAAATAEKIFREGRGIVEMSLITKDGRLVPTEYTGSLIKDAGGQPRYIVAVGRDITERKRAEEALRESERSLVEAQRLAHVGSWVWDIRTGEVKWSEEVYRIFGLDPADFHPDIDSVMNRFHPDDRKLYEEVIAQAVANREQYTFETRILLPDGSVRFLISTSEGHYDDGGGLVRISGTVQDITERKRAEEALKEYSERLEEIVEQRTAELRESEEKMRAQYKGIPAPTYTWQKVGEDFVLVDYNDAAVAITQGKIADFVGIKVSEMYRDMPEIREEISRCFAEKITIEREMPYRFRSTGESKYLAVKYAFVPPDLVLVHTEDITERKEMQEQLVRQEKLAMLGQLAGGMAHELRNPLGVISNAVYFLQMILPGADETTKEYLDIIFSEVDNAKNIVSDLLDFSHTRIPAKEEIAVADLVAQVLQKRPPPENVEVITEIASGLPSLYVDSRQIRQVLVNLITNAYQAMSPLSSSPQAEGKQGGRLTISAQALSLPHARPEQSRRMRGRAGMGEVALSITDTGCGISQENMEKLFEPLFTTKARGIGLGLAVSRSLVEANGGSIEVESEVGEGSTFTIRLPTREAVS